MYLNQDVIKIQKIKKCKNMYCVNRKKEYIKNKYKEYMKLNQGVIEI